MLIFVASSNSIQIANNQIIQPEWIVQIHHGVFIGKKLNINEINIICIALIMLISKNKIKTIIHGVKEIIQVKNENNNIIYLFFLGILLISFNILMKKIEILLMNFIFFESMIISHFIKKVLLIKSIYIKNKIIRNTIIHINIDWFNTKTRDIANNTIISNILIKIKSLKLLVILIHNCFIFFKYINSHNLKGNMVIKKLWIIDTFNIFKNQIFILSKKNLIVLKI